MRAATLQEETYSVESRTVPADEMLGGLALGTASAGGRRRCIGICLVVASASAFRLTSAVLPVFNLVFNLQDFPDRILPVLADGTSSRFSCIF